MDERRIFRACKPVWDACRLTAIPNCRKHGLFSPSTLKAALLHHSPKRTQVRLRACLESGRGVMHFASWGIIGFWCKFSQVYVFVG